MRYRGSKSSILSTAAFLIASAVPQTAQAQVTLTPAASPSSGQAGVTTVNVTGSNFPTGTISPAQVQVSLAPAAGNSGPNVSTSASAITTIVGSTRRVTFTIPSSLAITSPVGYSISISGVTSTGVSFSSTNTASLTVNPPPSILSIFPNTAQAGQTATVIITTSFTNLVQGSTQASFGPGISVGTGPSGGFGTVTVTSATTAIAQLTVDLLASGPVNVTLQTGIQKATQTGGFSVTPVPAPAITSTTSPLPNAAGWNNSNPTITFTCTSATRTITSCSQPVTVSTEGANQTVTGTATDDLGRTASTSVTVNLDKSPPTASTTVTPSPNAAGWINSNATVSFRCSDALSGVRSCPSPVTLTTDGANQVVNGTAVDVAGNSAATGSATINLDKTPPSLTVLSPASGATISLSTASIGVNGTVSDGLSGLSNITCNGVSATLAGPNFSCTVTLSQGSNNIPIQATDVAGNSSTVNLALNYAQAPQITITSPGNLTVTNLTPVTVNGTVSDPNATITVNGIAAPQSSGTFSIPVPLVEGLNNLSAVATNNSGVAGTAAVQITLDTTPPHITIDSPADGAVVTDSSITVTGIANDVVVGTVNAQDVQVSVNGVTAQVANRNYSAMNVPLSVGPNTIQATGRDRAGNGTTTNITVTRALPTQPPAPPIGQAVSAYSLSIVSGNNQTGMVGGQLPTPLVVSLLDSNNQPVTNQALIFQVTANNGTVAGSSSPGDSSVAVNTDATGRAQVFWTLGQRAGAGNNTVQVSSAMAFNSVSFAASGTTSSASLIVVDSGNGQTGIAGQALPYPLVADVIDSGHNRVANVPVTFTVKQGGGSLGDQNAQTLTINTDSNGRAIAVLTLGLQEGINNNLVEADFPGDAGFPAAFAATGKAPGNPANTTISGVVLDNSNNAIQNATIRLYQANQGNTNNLPVQIGNPVQTSAQGTFLMTNAPVGSFKLMVDGSTATGPNTYPPLEYDIVTIAGNDNTVGMPIYLPALDTVNKLCVDATNGGTLTLPSYPGFSLTVLPGSATFPGGSKTGCVSVTPVNGDKVPMTPGFGQQPRFIVTIQPVGTTFNPPAPITLPNVDGLAPKAVTEMYSYDHDLAMFVAIGTGTVSDDGAIIASNSGVGVLKAGWHCGGNPNTVGSAGECGYCATCVNDKCQAAAGPVPPGAPICQTYICSNGSATSIPDDSQVPPQNDAPQCKKNVCSGGGISAIADPSQNGQKCDDGDPTTVLDSCMDGVCRGKTIAISSVWSDQFPGVRANYLPGGTGRDPYVFMATRADGNAYVKAKVDLNPPDPNGQSSIMVALAQDGTPIAGTSGMSGDIASISTSYPSSLGNVQDYDVVAGVDVNGNGFLDQSEVVATSSSLTGFPHSLKIVPSVVYSLNTAGALAGSFFTAGLYPTAASFLQAFAGGVVPDGATVIQTASLAKNELVHNVGALFNADGTAQVPLYIFPSTSAVAQRILLSQDFLNCVLKTLNGHAQDVRSYFAQPNTSGPHQFTWPMISNDPSNPTNIIFPNSQDLFLAYGTTQALIATMNVTVVQTQSGQLEPVQIALTGSVQDTYAWDYERGGIDARAATIQAGFGTLGQGGQVYKTQVTLDGPFVLTAPYFF